VRLAAEVTELGEAAFGLAHDVVASLAIEALLLGVVHDHEPPRGDAARLGGDLLDPQAALEGLVPAGALRGLHHLTLAAGPESLADDERVTGALQDAAVGSRC
jgi:hypothetical protein